MRTFLLLALFVPACALSHRLPYECAAEPAVVVFEVDRGDLERPRVVGGADGLAFVVTHAHPGSGADLLFAHGSGDLVGPFTQEIVASDPTWRTCGYPASAARIGSTLALGWIDQIVLGDAAGSGVTWQPPTRIVEARCYGIVAELVPSGTDFTVVSGPSLSIGALDAAGVFVPGEARDEPERPEPPAATTWAAEGYAIARTARGVDVWVEAYHPAIGRRHVEIDGGLTTPLRPTVTSLPDDTLVVAWSSSLGIELRRYGATLGDTLEPIGEALLETAPATRPRAPSLLATDRFVVVASMGDEGVRIDFFDHALSPAAPTVEIAARPGPGGHPQVELAVREDGAVVAHFVDVTGGRATTHAAAVVCR